MNFTVLLKRLKAHFSYVVLFSLVLLYGCSTVGSVRLGRERLLFIYDSSDKLSVSCIQNAKFAFKYAKIKYDVFDLKNYSGKTTVDLGKYYAIVLAVENLDKLSDYDCGRIESYVRSGGGLAVIYRGYTERFSKLFGARVKTGAEMFLEGTSGLIFTEDFVPGLKGLVISREETGGLSPYNFEYFGDKVIFAVSFDKVPIAWYLRYGRGRVVYWNTALLSDRAFRGFITQTVAVVAGRFVQPIANFAVIFLDDFPADVPNSTHEIIWREFRQTVAEFHVLTWFPDMVRLANDFDLKYSAYLIFNYNDKTEPPFDMKGWVTGVADVSGKKVKVAPFLARLIARKFKKRIELGLHGYNHISLLVKNWGSLENMVQALKFAMKKWKEEGLGELPFTYVAPNNWIDSIGVQAIVRGAPSIKVISTIYLGDFKVGQMREFGPEPWNPKLYCIPRVSEGYIPDNYEILNTLNAIAMLGVWTHFIHPDDVIATYDRLKDSTLVRNWNRLPWRNVRWGGRFKPGFYDGFRNFLSRIKKIYPFLRFMTTREAYYEMQKFDNLKIGYKFNKNSIIIETNEKAYAVVQLDPAYKVIGLSGCKVEYAVKTAFTKYLVIKTSAGRAVIKIKM